MTVQVYCSLIAALLPPARSGKLPMEASRYRMLGWIDDEELTAALGPVKEQDQAPRRHQPRACIRRRPASLR